MKKHFMLFLCILMLFSACAAADSLPVYRAVPHTQEDNPFFDKVDPAWFNCSGDPVYENGSKRARYDVFTFPDEAQLKVDVNYLSYTEYDGEYFMIYGDDPAHPGGPFPHPSFDAEIGFVAFDQLADVMYQHAQAPELQHAELTALCLDDAKTAVETLLHKLGMNGYRCTMALDMSAERIHEWGTAYVEQHKTCYNVFDRYYDFGVATESDEGYLLIYEFFVNDIPAVGNPDGYEYVQAFVNADGIVSFEMRSSYTIGDAIYTPDRLLTQEEIRAVFESHNERRIQDGFLSPAFTGAVLKYCPMRAENKADGMVYAPAWYVTYTFLDRTQLCDGWAWYSALDGKLIMDCYS